MIKIENVDVFGWKAAVRGMRNPMNSWSKSDSAFIGDVGGQFYIGEDDLDLMKRLAKAGSDHGKFLRMINVTVDITAPLYWWKEFDTYKVGTVANSCSTMHKIAAKEFEESDFSVEHLFDFESEDIEFPIIYGKEHTPIWSLHVTIRMLNFYREKYLKTKDKKYWWQLIQLLPASYNQRRTVQLNYEVLRKMYDARKNHKLDEWIEFCKWVETLPYFNEIVLGVQK